jgi:hypothetical protein
MAMPLLERIVQSGAFKAEPPLAVIALPDMMPSVPRPTTHGNPPLPEIV